MLIYLADLRHNGVTLATDTMPLGIGQLASYATARLGSDVQFKLFAYPQDLIEELRHVRPDLLGVTNYCWNYALQSYALGFARGLYPDLLTVMGGPNIALHEEGREKLLRETADLDVYVVDEGEQAFVAMLELYLGTGMDKARLLKDPIPSSVHIDPDSGLALRGVPALRMRQLDEIPSPYTSGLMDKFFNGELSPLVQTTRGCPFTCTFCVEGVSYMTKVNKFSTARTEEELEYIARRPAIGSSLMFSDSNFGMLPGDLDTARIVRRLQQEGGWPKYVWATTGKNNKTAIMEAIDLLGGTMKMTNSVQSMDKTVLANIKRSNIKLETYSELQRELKDRNLASYAEVIIGLPGEPMDTFVKGIRQLLDSGVQEVSLYQLMLLDGTEIKDESTRTKYDLKTMFRLIPQNFGTYAEEPVFEMEEIVVTTSTLSFEDYMECRKLQLILQVYHRERLFGELLEYLSMHDVPISDFIMDLLDHLDDAPTEVKALFADYLTEAGEELFSSREEAHQHMVKNYERLVAGEIGGNLMYKYSAVAWFKTLGPVLDYGIQRATALVLNQPDRAAKDPRLVAQELEAIGRYLLAVIIKDVDITNRLEDVEMTLDYDVDGWREGGYERPLSEFQHPLQPVNGTSRPEPREYTAYVTGPLTVYLLDKLRVYGDSSSGMGRMLSRVVWRDLRRKVRPAREHAITHSTQ